MTGPPGVKPLAESAPSVNRAPQTVMVRLHDGDLAGRVSVKFAKKLLASGAAYPAGKTRLRYIRLQPGIRISESARGWALIEEERRRHGDNAVRRGVAAFERSSLKWQSPKASLLIASTND